MRPTALLPFLALALPLGLGSCSIHWFDGESHPHSRTIEFLLTEDQARALTITGTLTDVEIHGGAPQPHVVAQVRERYPMAGEVTLVDGVLSYRGLAGDENDGFMEHVTVWLPARVASLNVEVSIGDVSIHDVAASGAVAIDSGLGDIELGRLSVDGEVDVQTGLGDVEASDIDGTLRVDSGLGDLRITRLRGPLASFTTGLGDIRLTALDVKALDYSTGLGDVKAERMSDSFPQPTSVFQ